MTNKTNNISKLAKVARIAHTTCKRIQDLTGLTMAMASCPEEETMLILMGYERSEYGDWWIMRRSRSA